MDHFVQFKLPSPFFVIIFTSQFPTLTLLPSLGFCLHFFESSLTKNKYAINIPFHYSSYSDELTFLSSFLLQLNVQGTMKSLETFIQRQTCPKEKKRKETGNL